MNGLEYKFQTFGQVICSLLILWCICIVVGLTGLYEQTGSMPNFLEAVKIGHVFLLVALPKSLTNLIGITKVSNLQGVIPSVILFWVILLRCFFVLFKSKLCFLYIALAIILILSSWNWLVVSYSLLGV